MQQDSSDANSFDIGIVFIILHRLSGRGSARLERGACGAKVAGSTSVENSMYKVYILRSMKTHRYYAGHCADLENRLQEHNSRETKSTRGGIPWKLIYTETFATRGGAMQRENQIKKRGIARFLRGVAQPG